MLTCLMHKPGVDTLPINSVCRFVSEIGYENRKPVWNTALKATQPGHLLEILSEADVGI